MNSHRYCKKRLSVYDEIKNILDRDIKSPTEHTRMLLDIVSKLIEQIKTTNRELLVAKNNHINYLKFLTDLKSIVSSNGNLTEQLLSAMIYEHGLN